MKNMSAMITFYNSEVESFKDTFPHADCKTRNKTVNNFINIDATKNS